ncbi:hypothetical protein OAM21_03710 [Verrucomicrobia bacterium]|nr:hypothetical protein [Verrucomicrobiota bacterium]
MPNFTCVFVENDKKTVHGSVHSVGASETKSISVNNAEAAALSYKAENTSIWSKGGPYVRVRDENGQEYFFRFCEDEHGKTQAIEDLRQDANEDNHVNEDNPILKKLIHDLFSKHGSSRSTKLDFLKEEGHGGFFVTNKEITKVFESAVKESALKTFKKNEKANRLAKERTDSIKKVTALLASRSVLELELNDRHKIDNNLLSIAEKYKNHPLEKYEIEFLESYSNAKHLQIGNELLAMTSDNSGIKKAAGKVGVASTIAAVSSAIVHNQMAESISNIEENTEEIAESFEE